MFKFIRLRGTELMGADIICIGGISADMKAFADDEPRIGNFGLGKVHFSIGGVAKNMAENISKLGFSAHLISAVGDDLLGEFILQQLATSGVNVSHVARNKGTTSSYVAILDMGGKPYIDVFDASVFASITPELLKSQESVFYTSKVIAVDLNIPNDSLRYLGALSLQFNIPYFVNFTTPTLSSKGINLLEFKPIVCMNLHELKTIALPDIFDIPSAVGYSYELLRLGARGVVITLGDKGALYTNSMSCWHITAPPADVVDTTGGGDAFVSGLIVANVRNLTIPESLEFAAALSAFTIESYETVSSSISIEAIEHRVKLNKQVGTLTEFAPVQQIDTSL